MGVDLVKLGGNSLSAGLGTEIIVAFDPLDPMLFVKIVPPVGGIIWLSLGPRTAISPIDLKTHSRTSDLYSMVL